MSPRVPRRLWESLAALRPSLPHAAPPLILPLLLLLPACGDEPPPEPSGRLRFVDPASVDGTALTEETASALYSAVLKGGRFQYDPEQWVALKPDSGSTPVEWPEHPLGTIAHTANNMGFREDTPTAFEKHGYRILVTGDSHTEGAVNNSESFANVLEASFLRRFGQQGQWPPVEVINAGIGGTGPFLYLAVLAKRLPMQPDMCIAALYVGNDFMNALVHSDFLTKRQPKPHDQAYFDRMNKALETWPGLPQQGYNQPYLFKRRPGDEQLALDATLTAYESMARLCAQNGIRFLAVVIPCKADVDDGDDGERIQALLDTLELSAQDWASNERLTDGFVQGLRERGIEVLDPRAAMRAEKQPLYWRKDHHLNIAGHALIAREIEALVGGAIENVVTRAAAGH